MKFNAIAKTTAAGAVALLVAGCGGGSGDVATPPAQPPAASLQLSGTAATGLALASASVEVKCAEGTGTTTTSASGSYTVTLEGGKLPCMIRVTGTKDGAEVTLHSVTEAGTADAATNQTSAVANVTPLTEIVVAQLTGGLPGEAFAAFSDTSATQITTEKLTAATTTVLTALKDATGLDFTATGDPFKATLVAATSPTEKVDNPYDNLLDDLGKKVAIEALPQVVTQVAAAAASGSSAGLQDAMVAVDAGTLPNCPAVLSGKYRFLEYFGSSYVRTLNFKTMTAARPDGTTFPITVDDTKPCEFAIESVSTAGNEVKFEFAMGPAGVGAARIQNITAGRTNVAWIFPEQSHTVSELVGSWTFHQGGFMPAPENRLIHWPGKLEVAADGKASACDYEFGASTWSTCTPDTEANLTIAARTDGGFNLMDSSLVVANAWGYRAPNGSLTVFGTTNAAGSSDPAVEQTVLVLFKPQTQQLPAVGSVSKYWDVTVARRDGQNNATIVADSNTIMSVDSAASTAFRKRTSDGREDSFVYNAPLDGLRYRAQVPGMLGVYLLPLPGLGATLAVNSAESATHLYNISLFRP